jgi:hypothetical protein
MVTVSSTEFAWSGKHWRHSTTIDNLPDIVLLDIFVLYRNNHNENYKILNNTYVVKSATVRALVHVC